MDATLLSQAALKPGQSRHALYPGTFDPITNGHLDIIHRGLRYLFATQHVQKKYSNSSLAFYQCVIAFLVTLPHGARHMPPLHLLMDTVLIIEILYIGILCVGIAFYLEILGIEHLGPTITGVYLNFLPVISSIGALLIVHESLIIWQITGGIIVIAAGIMVIREKERLNQIVVK